MDEQYTLPKIKVMRIIKTNPSAENPATDKNLISDGAN